MGLFNVPLSAMPTQLCVSIVELCNVYTIVNCFHLNNPSLTDSLMILFWKLQVDEGSTSNRKSAAVSIHLRGRVDYGKSWKTRLGLTSPDDGRYASRARYQGVLYFLLLPSSRLTSTFHAANEGRIRCRS